MAGISEKCGVAIGWQQLPCGAAPSESWAGRALDEFTRRKQQACEGVGENESMSGTSPLVNENSSKSLAVRRCMAVFA